MRKNLIILTLTVLFLGTWWSSYHVPTAAAGSSGSGWITDRLVFADSSNTERRPSLASDSDGNLWAAFEHFNNQTGHYEIYVSESTDGGVTWTWIRRAYSTSTPTHDFTYPSIAIDPETDNIYVVYQVDEDATHHDIDVLRCVGGVWSISYVKSGSDDRFPSITSEYEYTQNYQYITYEHVNSYNNRDLVFAKSTDNATTWTTTTLYPGSTSRCYSNSTITNTQDPSGNPYIYIAYRNSTAYNGGVSDICVTNSSDWGDTWKIVNKNVKGTLPNDVSQPSITAIHGGKAVIVAFQYSGGATTSDIYYACSSDNGLTWSNGNNNPLAATADNEFAPALAVDGGGSTGNVASSYIHLAYLDNYVIKYTSLYVSAPIGSSIVAYPVSSWSSPQTVNSGIAASTIYSKPAITTSYRSDSAAYYPCVAWTDSRGKSYDVYCSTPGTLYTITFRFMDSGNANDLTSGVSWVLLKSPSGGYLNLTSSSTAALTGRWAVIKIVYQRTNVVPLVNPSYTLSSDYAWTIRCRVTTVNFANSFLDSSGTALSVKPTGFTLVWPYGETTSLLTPGNYYLQNGTWAWKTILWEGSNVAPAAATTFNSESGNPTIRLNIYRVDFTNKFKDSQGNTVSIDSFRLVCPNGTTTKALSAGTYYLQNGTFQIASVMYQNTPITQLSSTNFDPSSSSGLNTIAVTLPFAMSPLLMLVIGGVALGAVVAVAAHKRKPKAPKSAAPQPVASPQVYPQPLSRPAPPVMSSPPMVEPQPMKPSAYNEEIARYQRAIAVLENQRTIGEISIESYNLAINNLQRRLQELVQFKEDVTRTKRSIIETIQAKGSIGRADIIKDYTSSTEVANVALEEFLRDNIIEQTESGERYRLKGRTKRCPYCRGSIPADLDVCPLCGSTFR